MKVKPQFEYGVLFIIGISYICMMGLNYAITNALIITAILGFCELVFKKSIILINEIIFISILITQVYIINPENYKFNALKIFVLSLCIMLLIFLIFKYIKRYKKSFVFSEKRNLNILIKLVSTISFISFGLITFFVLDYMIEPLKIDFITISYFTILLFAIIIASVFIIKKPKKDLHTICKEISVEFFSLIGNMLLLLIGYLWWVITNVGVAFGGNIDPKTVDAMSIIMIFACILTVFELVSKRRLLMLNAMVVIFGMTAIGGFDIINCIYIASLLIIYITQYDKCFKVSISSDEK